MQVLLFIKVFTDLFGSTSSFLCLEVEAFHIICVSNYRNRRNKSGEENKLLPKLWVSLSNNMDPDKYFSAYNLKNAGRKQKFGYANKSAI